MIPPALIKKTEHILLLQNCTIYLFICQLIRYGTSNYFAFIAAPVSLMVAPMRKEHKYLHLVVYKSVPKISAHLVPTSYSLSSSLTAMMTPSFS
jgi:hypothetical protein